MRSFIILIVAFVVASLAVANAEAGFNAINEYLVGKVSDNDVESNMKAAVQWLKDLESTKSKPLFNNPTKDLKKFTSLQQVIEDAKCDPAALRIMEENESEKKSQSVRRVDTVLNQIFVDHAMKCLQVYSTDFETKKEKLGATFDNVRNIGRKIMEKDAYEYEEQVEKWDLGDNFYDLDNIFGHYITGKFSITRVDYSEYLYGALRTNAKGDNAKYLNKQADEKTGKMFVAKDKVKELVKESLVKPCNEYMITFGSDLVKIARFDARYYQSQQSEKSKFYYGMAYYAMCKSLVDMESSVTSNIIKYISHS